MAKGYWVVTYRALTNPEALGEYGKIAVPLIQAAGGRLVTRGMPARTFEGGLNQRAVIVEFDSVQQAIACFESPAYQAAAKLLKGAAERDIRIMEGV